MRIGYCTNVHAGATLDAALANLARHAPAVRDRLGFSELDIGLWLPRAALGEALARLPDLRAFLADHRLRVFTLNAFPYDDFHQERVKHAVYRPTWADLERLEYTLDAARLLAELTPEGAVAPISTLPIAWRDDSDKELVVRAGANLRTLADKLARLHDQTGRLIRVELEPEPGCVLDTALGVVDFFNRELPDQQHRRYLGVCHDVCHAAVMFEDQRTVLQQYADAGIRVGKVQVSSCLRAPEGHADPGGALIGFAEDRYLHQTVVRSGNETWFHDDLGDAIRAGLAGEWRVHYHVPIFAEHVAGMTTTRDQIMPAINAARELHATDVFEVETYAWDVLPSAARPDVLADGIAEEIRWLSARIPEPRTIAP